VLQWLVDAAEQLRAFSQYFLHDVRVRQVQLDKLFALLSTARKNYAASSAGCDTPNFASSFVFVYVH
jgi:hypothetical protein